MSAIDNSLLFENAGIRPLSARLGDELSRPSTFGAGKSIVRREVDNNCESSSQIMSSKDNACTATEWKSELAAKLLAALNQHGSHEPALPLELLWRKTSDHSGEGVRRTTVHTAYPLRFLDERAHTKTNGVCPHDPHSRPYSLIVQTTLIQMAGYAFLVALSGAGLLYVRKRLEDKRRAEIVTTRQNVGGIVHR